MSGEGGRPISSHPLAGGGLGAGANRDPRPAEDVDDISYIRRREGIGSAGELRVRGTDYQIRKRYLRRVLLRVVRTRRGNVEAPTVVIVSGGADIPLHCSE